MTIQKVTRCYLIGDRNVLPADNAPKCSKNPNVADRRFMAVFSQNEVASFDRSRTISFLNGRALLLS